IGPHGFLNQHCALAPDLESILRARMGKIVLQHYLPTTDIANCYICALGGRNSMTAIRAIRMKMASTAACVTAKGGSVCVGANELRAETFPKLCTTKTKTLR